MLRLTLTPEQQEELARLRRDRSLQPLERDRVEMVRLADKGWRAPAIAEHLDYHPNTVRHVLKQVLADGLSTLRLKPFGRPPDRARRAHITAALTTHLREARTWTSRQLAIALRDDGIALSGRQVRRYLTQLSAGYRRTARTVRHKQDPARVAQAARALHALQKKPLLVS